MKEFIFYAISFICHLVIATEWAKYGLAQIGIQRPPNNKVSVSALVGIITFIIGGYLQKNGKVDLIFFKEEYAWTAGFILLGVFFTWIIFFRYVIMPNGQFDYNRAIIRTTYWTIGHYQPGQSLEDKADLLRNFPQANKTLELFKRAIKAQEKGVVTGSHQNVVQISTDSSYYGDTISVACPSCGISTPTPIYIPDGIEGQCKYCGVRLSAKSIGDKLYLNSYGSRTYIVTPTNLRNIATGYEEMALLYRMMNLFGEAHRSLDKALRIVEDLITEEGQNKDFLSLKSLILFRKGESYQAEGSQLEKARSFYLESIRIDERIGINGDNDFVKKLISQLG